MGAVKQWAIHEAEARGLDWDEFIDEHLGRVPEFDLLPDEQLEGWALREGWHPGFDDLAGQVMGVDPAEAYPEISPAELEEILAFA